MKIVVGLSNYLSTQRRKETAYELVVTRIGR